MFVLWMVSSSGVDIPGKYFRSMKKLLFTQKLFAAIFGLLVVDRYGGMFPSL
jgi:hypothetical protein